MKCPFEWVVYRMKSAKSSISIISCIKIQTVFLYADICAYCARPIVRQIHTSRFLAPLISPYTSPCLTLHRLLLPSMHLLRLLIDTRCLLRVWESDIPVPRWGTRTFPVVSMPRYRLLVRNDRCMPFRIHFWFIIPVCCTGADAPVP